MKNIVHLKNSPEQEEKIKKFKEYQDTIPKTMTGLDEKMAVIYGLDSKQMYVASKIRKVFITVLGIETNEEAEQVIEILKQHDPREWKKILEGAGYVVKPGSEFSFK